MKHFTQQTPSRRNVRVFIATLLSYLMLVGQVAPLALASNNSGLRAAPAAKAEGTAAGEVQGLNAAPEPAPLAPPATTVTATKTDSFPNHGDGKAAPGDEITYAVNVSATGGDATNVQFTDSVGANTTFVPGSVTMSPLARNDAYTATAGTPLTVPAGGVLSNDSGLPAPSAVAISNGPTTKGGTVTLNTDGSFTYTQPAGAFSGTDSFTYTATNSNSPDDTATVTIDFNPGAAADSATVNEDSGATAIDVLANDPDPDGGSKSINSVTQPANGTVVITGGGTGLTYQPNANYCNDGSPLDTFTYTLTPGGSTATVSVTVTCVDDAPVAVNDSATVVEDSGANAVDVLANDTDIDGGPKSVVSVTQPANGTVVITGGGTGLTYQPNANYCNNPPGSTLDTFTYTLAPGGSSATVTMTVTCVDDAPVAVNDSATVVEDSGSNSIDVLANDTDTDGGPKSIASVTQPANGTVVITGGGTGLTYQPNANYCNNPPGTTPDTFTYTLTPGSSSATVSVTVTCVDDNPVAVNDSATVSEDSGATGIDVLLNDTDIDGGPKSVASVTQPANGTVVITGGGAGLTYAPNANYCNNPPGTTLDTFTYMLTPGGSSATVTVTVTCVNDGPVIDLDANDDKGTSGSDFAATFVPGGAASLIEDSADASVSDVDNTTLASLTVTITNLLDSGKETLSADVTGTSITANYAESAGAGTLTLTGPDTVANFQQVLRTVKYQDTAASPNTTARVVHFVSNDGTSDGNTAVSTVSFDQPPTAVNDSSTVNEDSGANTINVLANDTDPDGGPKSITSVTQPANGTVAITNSGADLTYTPNANYCNNPPGSALDTFTYTLSPGGSTATVTMTVTCANDAPTVDPATFSLNENSPNGTAVGTVTYSDVDNPAAGQTHTCAITAGNTGGAFAINPSTCAITVANSAAVNFETTPTFSLTVTVTDNGTPNLSGSNTITVNLNDVNEAPVVNPATFAIAENSANGTSVGTVTYSDPDAGQTKTCAITAGNTGTAFAIDPSTCAITVNNSAALDFETTPTFSLTVQVTDNGTPNLSGTATITVNLSNANESPTANPDTASVTEAGGVNNGTAGTNITSGFNVITGTGTGSVADTDPDAGDTLTIKGVAGGNQGNTVLSSNVGSGITSSNNYGTLTLSSNGSYTYVVNQTNTTVQGLRTSGDTATDVFTYTLRDAAGLTSNTTITITIHGANDNPVAVADSANAVEAGGTGNGTAGTDPTGNVLTNDTDVDSGDTKTVQGVLDGNQGSTPVSGNVGTGGSFGPGISANAPNDYGSLVMKDTGEFAFTVNQNNATVQALRSGQSVDAIYTYTVRDTAGATSNALLTIHIMGANDAPTINKPASLSATEDTPLTITTVSVADVDAGSNPVKVTLDLSHGKINLASVAGLTFVDATANNSASLHFTGTLTNVNAAMNGMTYTPDLNFNDTQTPGGDSLAITVNDQDAGGALSASGSVPISVASVNDPPTAGTDTFDTIGNTELRVDLSAGTTPAVSKTTASGKGVLGNDSDPVEGNPIAVTGIVGCADNTAPFDCTVSGQHIVMNANGTFSYVPAPGATSGTFQYTVTDDPTTTGGSPASVNGTVNINIFDKVWYVKAGAAGGNGTSEKPFGDFTSLNGAAGAGDSDGPGDYIFVYAGAYTITGGLELEADQHLYGEGFGLSLNRALNGNSAPVTLVAAGTYPTVTSAVDTIKMTAALPAEIRGLSLSSSGGNAIDLTAAGAYSGATALLISGNTFTGSTLQTVDINSAATGNRTVTVENNMWSGTHTGNGIDIALTAGGSLFVDVSGNNVVANSTAINIARTGGGTLTIQDFAGNVVSGNTGGNGIVVNTATFDSNSASAGFQSVSGGATAVGASGNGVGGSGVTLSNVQGILDFTDLDIYADNGAGFTASGTGGGFTVSTASGNSNIVAIGGPAVDINAAAITLPLQKITSTNSASAGVSLVNTTGSFSADNTSAITNAATTGVNVNGGSSSVTYNGTITDDVGQLVNVANTTGGTKEFTGAITDGDDGDGGGVSLTNNGGATISFRGGLVISTGANPGFTATGGGTVEVCNENPCNPNATGGLVNKITTTTGTALNVANTTISANKLEFKSISANGAANGIVLNNTGASGSLVVTGNNTNTLGGDASGGTIQNSTGDAISLTSTLSPSFTNVTISFNAAVQVAGSGVHGTQVTNFTFKNSTVSNTGHNLDTTNSFIGESDLRFDTQVAGTENNLSGAVTITNNVLNNALTDGVRIYNFNGTISDLNISNNSLTSGTTTGTSGNSKGTGINVQILGSAATVSNLTKATIANNTIANFPGGAGIEVQGGNANTSGNGGTVGTPGNVTNVVSITGNNIHGQSNVNRMGTSAILVTVGGGRAASRSQGNFDISNNGTVANPLTNIAGTVIGVGANGYATVESLVNNNVIVANHAVAGTASNGVAIAGGVVTGTSDTPDLTAKVTNNNISQTDGNGILAVTRGVTGFLKVTIKSNTVTAPLSGNREGIRVDAGNLASVDDAVCADIQSNTSDGSGVATGIGLRKQGTAPTVNDFGIEGMAATSSPGVEAYVNGLNPAGGSTELISATSGFTNCASAPNAPVSSGASASSSFAPAQSKLGRAVTDEAHSSATRRDLIDADPTPTFGFSPDAPFFLFGNKAPAPVSAPAVSPTVNPAPVVNNAPAADAPARVWSDMPIIINRAPLSDSATDDKSADKDEDSAKEKDDAAKDSDATSDSQAAPKKARKPARTKKADDQPESSQPENRNISYLGPLGSAPSRAPQFVRASYEAGDAVRNSRAVGDAVVPRDRSVKAAPAAARAAAAPLVVPDVSVNVGTLPAGKSVTIRFKATVNSPFPDGVTQVSNQGSVTYAESGSPVLTDDPDVAGASDPTVTPVNAVSMHVNDASAPELASGNSTMLFTVALVAPAPGSGVSVNYATANGGANPATGGASCGGAVDYQTTSGTLTFASGEKVKTIPVTICADTSSPETDETLLLNISGASSGTITDAQAVGTITQGNTAGTILISELRTSGPNGPADEFVELYNNTETNQDISGYGLFKKGADCAASPVLIAAIPGAPGSNTTVMPARSHYLLVGSQYSLKDYGGTDAAKGDQTLTSDIEADANVGLFTVTDPNLVSTAAKVDGVGFGTNTGGACDLLREGTNLPPVSGSPTEHTFFRKQCDFVGGVGCSTPGNPKDTNDNSVDFTFADTEATPIAGVQQRLGAPGPENKTSPVRRDDKGLNLLVLDQSKSSSAVPNRVRNGAMGDPDTSTFGTLVIRRRVVNNTGADVTRLRFRIVEMTTAATSPGVADLRAITGDDEASVGPVGDTATCFASNGVATTPCSVSVSKTTLETPPAQSKGGGLNSTLTVLLGTPLQNGKSLNVNFKLGVQTTGTFRFLVITEALP